MSSAVATNIALVLLGAIIGSVVKTFLELALRIRIEKMYKQRRKAKKKAKRLLKLQQQAIPLFYRLMETLLSLLIPAGTVKRIT